MKFHYSLDLTILVIVATTVAQSNVKQSQLVCANSYNSPPREEENVKCVTVDGSTTLGLECDLVKNYKLKKKIHANVIKSKLVISPIPDNLNESVFSWENEDDYFGAQQQEQEQEQEQSFYKNSDLFRNYTVPLSINAEKDEAYSEIVLYNIKSERLYTVCAQVPGAIEEPVCCQIENVNEEIASNIFMVLIVIGILVVIYLIIVFSYWMWPPSSYDSIDDMLSKLPDSHVERLKSLVVDQIPIDYEDDEEETILEDEESRPRKPRVRIDSHLVEIGDNPAFEASDEEEAAERPKHPKASSRRMSRASGTKSDEDEVEANLRKEAMKLRRMSRMSVGSIIAQPNQKGVKFTDTVLNINDIEDLKIKIYNESKRRASIKDLKKPYGLDVSDSD